MKPSDFVALVELDAPKNETVGEYLHRAAENGFILKSDMVGLIEEYGMAVLSRDAAELAANIKNGMPLFFTVVE